MKKFSLIEVALGNNAVINDEDSETETGQTKPNNTEDSKQEENE